jgi:BirA family biotin operon repressor/biotin-[acetyl-CoA-carboxylase] ligase
MIFILKFIFDTLPSTNTYAKENLSSISIPSLIIANHQTDGRGRRGNSFFSPKGTGLYMTLVFEEKNNSDLLTPLAAVCVCEELEKLGANPKIKWVNDIFIDSRKICGILTERQILNDKAYIILGIGINLSTESFPADLTIKAGSLGAASVTKEAKRALALDLFGRLLTLLESEDTSRAMQIYRERSTVIGRRVSFMQSGAEITATALDVTDLGALVLKLDSGETLELSTGEISIFVQKEQI